MHKYFILVITMLMPAAHIYAQDAANGSSYMHFARAAYGGADNRNNDKPAWAYLGFSVGINSPAGLAGVDMDVPVGGQASVAAGAGWSTWGAKVHLDAKYYLRSCTDGFAFGGGFTFSSGRNDYSYPLGDYRIIYARLHPQANIFAAAYYYFNVGRVFDRGYVALGWSLPITAVRYDAYGNYGYVPSGSDLQQVNFIAPGGPVISFSQMFDLSKKHDWHPRPFPRHRHGFPWHPLY